MISHNRPQYQEHSPAGCELCMSIKYTRVWVQNRLDSNKKCWVMYQLRLDILPSHTRTENLLSKNILQICTCSEEDCPYKILHSKNLRFLILPRSSVLYCVKSNLSNHHANASLGWCQESHGRLKRNKTRTNLVIAYTMGRCNMYTYRVSQILWLSSNTVFIQQ